MPVREDLPPYEDPEFDPESERLLLYRQILETMRDCDESGAIKTLWTNKYMAAVFGGVINVTEYHRHEVGLVHMVPLSPVNKINIGHYFLFEKCGPMTQRIRTLPSHRVPIPMDNRETALDVNAQYTLAHTIFTPGRSAEFAETVLQLYPATVVEPKVDALFREDPSLQRYIQYGACLLRMRDGSIPPLSPNEAAKYAIGTDSGTAA